MKAISEATEVETTTTAVARWAAATTRMQSTDLAVSAETAEVVLSEALVTVNHMAAHVRVVHIMAPIAAAFQAFLAATEYLVFLAAAAVSTSVRAAHEPL